MDEHAAVSGYLGGATGGKTPIAGGWWQPYQNGSLYYWPPSGAWVVQGRILVHYLALGGPTGFLGYPTTDETGTPDLVGRYNHFWNNGSIYWTPGTDARSIHGAIRDRWASLGWEAGPLGYPTTDEYGTPDGVGRYNHFSNGGSIYWSPSTGAWSIHGAIRDRWASLGWEAGPLGYPTTDESGTPDGVGRYNHFSNGGSIYWTPNTGAWSIHGSIRDRWTSMGRETSVLGYPITDENSTPDGVGRYNHFQGGSIYWSPSTGAWEVHGNIRNTWSSLGWERSRLGYPVSNEYGVPGGRRNDFQHGSITWIAASGAIQVIYN
jgi:uncharacterized protein with LGFP repeats